MARQAVLCLKDVSKRFGAFEVLRGVTMSVLDGTTQAIIGPNGAGKTTLVNVVSGLLKPSSGTIRLADEDISAAPAHEIARRGLIRTFQIASLFEELTVRENVEVAFVARHKYRPRGKEDSRRTDGPDEVIDLVGLAGVGDRRVDALSHGDQRLLEVAIALSVDPRVILLDEPTAGMSPLETACFIKLMNERLKTLYTLILIEHDMDVVMQTADRVTVLEGGRVLAEGPPGDIMQDAAVQEAYLGRT